MSPEVRKMVDAMTDVPGPASGALRGSLGLRSAGGVGDLAAGGTGPAGLLGHGPQGGVQRPARKWCDFCDGVASRVRHVVVPPEGDFGPIQRPGAMSAFAAFVILCDECVAIDPELWNRISWNGTPGSSSKPALSCWGLARRSSVNPSVARRDSLSAVPSSRASAAANPSGSTRISLTRTVTTLRTLPSYAGNALIN